MNRLMTVMVTWAGLAVGALGFSYSAPPALASGYVYEGGYYWLNGVAYTRADYGYWYKEYYTAYTYSACGCYSYPYQTYRWKWYADYRYSPVRLNVNAPDIETQIIELAKARDKAVLRIAEREQKSAAAANLVDKLGLTGNFYVPNYGNGIFSSYYAPRVVQGDTAYGYSYKALADAYGKTDLNVLYQQAARLTEGAQGLAGDANTGFQGLVREAGAGSARVAEILAKGDAASRVLRAAAPDPSTHIRIEGVGAKGAGPQPRVNAAQQRQAEFLRLSGPAKCVQCHTGAERKGGFDISKYHPTTATDEEIEIIAKYVTSSVRAKKHCPPGVQLSAKELGELFDRGAGGEVPREMPPAKE